MIAGSWECGVSECILGVYRQGCVCGVLVECLGGGVGGCAFQTFQQ